jgi:hypothetical protein
MMHSEVSAVFGRETFQVTFQEIRSASEINTTKFPKHICFPCVTKEQGMTLELTCWLRILFVSAWQSDSALKLLEFVERSHTQTDISRGLFN